MDTKIVELANRKRICINARGEKLFDLSDKDLFVGCEWIPVLKFDQGLLRLEVGKEHRVVYLDERGKRLDYLGDQD